MLDSWDAMDCIPPGSSVHGISQARLLEWVSISFSRRAFWSRDRTCVACIGRWIPYHLARREAQVEWYSVPNLSRVFWLALFIHSFVNYLYNIHCLVAQSCATLCTPRLLCPWDSPGKNTGVDSHALLQGIFPAQMDSLPSEPPRKHNYPHNYNADSSLVCWL